MTEPLHNPDGSVVESAGEAVLDVEHLTVEFSTTVGRVRVVEDVSFSVARGRTFGLVGESGSGKSVTSLAVMGLIGPPNGHVPSGSIRLGGVALEHLSQRELRKVRGRRIGMIFQEPRRSLDPVFTIGDQIAETIRAHLDVSRSQARKRAVEALDLVQIPAAAKRVNDYPHQFSGGMAQRVMLAIALCCSPEVLIADEPTTALDVTVQKQVLDLIRSLQADMGLAVVFISHDLGVVAEMCDDVAVMYAGQIVESSPVERLFLHPRHPYTEALLGAIPSAYDDGGPMLAITGVVPPSHHWPTGCRFHPRCSYAVDQCSVADLAFPEGNRVRCIRTMELNLAGIDG